MEIGVIGLGKMGYNIALNMLDNGLEVIGYDINPDSIQAAKEKNIFTTSSIVELIDMLPEQKIIWVMVPAGKPTTDTLESLSYALNGKNAIVIDGGNTNYKKTLEHHQFMKNNGISFLDCGTSGGISGARNGACLMIGGDEKIFNQVENVFKAIATKDGYLYTGGAGSGHYLKMVHNGIEYGMMQAIAEGFELLEACEYDYNLKDVSHVWNNGSVIRSWLIELAEEAFQGDPKLDKITGVVDSNGEGEWTVESALEHKVPLPVISTAVFTRYRSKQNDTFTGKVLAALRNGFGGHSVVKK